MVQSGWNSNSSEILCISSLPASIKRIGSKTTKKRWRHRFPHYKPMGAFCCYGNQEFWSNLPQNLMQPFPHPSDATYNIWSRLAKWLQRYSSLKVWTTDDDDGPLVYYKLTLWAFGSGELKILINSVWHPDDTSMQILETLHPLWPWKLCWGFGVILKIRLRSSKTNQFFIQAKWYIHTFVENCLKVL